MADEQSILIGGTVEKRIDWRRVLICFVGALLVLWLLLDEIKIRRQSSQISSLSLETKQVAQNQTGSALSHWEYQKVYEWGRDELSELKNTTDFRDFSLKLRKLKVLFTHYEANVDSLESDAEYHSMPVLQEMEQMMFPWAFYYYSTLLQMKRSFNGAGIVIPTGSHHFRMAVFLVRTIRELGCQLPICIAHGGDTDLKPQELFYLYQLKAKALDVSEYVNTKQLELKGWQIKPFAILVAPFSEVILMDADVVLMKNPEFMLQDGGYKEHGAIYFRDRTLFDKDWKKTLWLDTNLVPPLSKQVLETRMYRQLSGHEQESGIVVINKNKRLFSLLAACKLNGKVERDEVVYKEFYGDKETFWIGTEMAGESYTTLWPSAGVIGQLHDLAWIRYEKELDEARREKDKKKRIKPRKPKGKDSGDPKVVCGRIVHFDRTGEPLWFNGGIVLDKGDETKRDFLNTFTHYSYEGTWDFYTGCIMKSEAIPIPTNVSNILKEMGRIWRPKINLIDIENFHLKV